jgi:hypothetical protein
LHKADIVAFTTFQFGWTQTHYCYEATIIAKNFIKSIILFFLHFSYFYIILIYMGRKKIYKTVKEQIEARKARQMRYYERNKELVKQKNMRRYYEKYCNK